jgi:hypothetical protein
MATFIVIVFTILSVSVIIMVFMKPTQSEISPAVSAPPIKIEPIQEPAKSTDLLDDRETSFYDYSDMSPSEARREYNERKGSGEWLDFDEYGGLMNAIYASSDDRNVEKIENMTPERAFEWYQRQKDEGRWVTSVVFDALAKRLKPEHESYLLEAMDKLTPGRIEGWVNARKKEGYFFSEAAYDKANKILLGEIDNRRKRKPKTP